MVESQNSNDDIARRMELQYRVEQFYYQEATALDERRFPEWLDMFTDDVHYWMPIRRTTLTKNKDMEFTKPGDMAYFDDTKELLAIRTTKLSSNHSWSENPASRSRHLITNVQILEDGGPVLKVMSNFHLYRVRFDSDEDSWFGRRVDELVPHEGSFRIKKRAIYLEQTVILARNMSVLF